MTTILALNSSKFKEMYKKKQSLSASADVLNVNSQHDRPSAEIIIYPGIRRERLHVTDSEFEPGTDLYSVKLTHNN